MRKVVAAKMPIAAKRTAAVLKVVTVVALAVLALAGTVSANDGAPFAALEVRSNGRQVIDITTGVTTLPDGGNVVDKQTGVSFTAGHIAYLDGAFIEASAVLLEGAFGVLSADGVRIDIASSSLVATGDLTLRREGLEVVASELTYFALTEVAVFEGGVTGNEPRFNAERVLLDVRTGDVLLDGRYSFAGDLFTMTSPEQGGLLELRLVELGDVVTYSAASEVSESLLERFRAYL